MKISDGFDARRLRPQEPKSWRRRLCKAFGALLVLFGLLSAALGVLSLAGRGDLVGSLQAGREGAIVLLVAGVVMLGLGLALRRRCRRHMRQLDGLSLSPHLMRKRG